MAIRIVARMQWILRECGGVSYTPAVGLRPQIRWLRYIEASRTITRDANIVRIDPTSDGRRVIVEMELSSNVPMEDAWLVDGHEIELLEGHRVIGVGKILLPPSLSDTC